MIRNFTLKKYTNHTAREAAKSAVIALTGVEPDTVTKNGDLCAFWTPDVLCEVARPSRIDEVFGNATLDSFKAGVAPMLLVYQHEDDTDDADKYEVIKAAQLVQNYWEAHRRDSDYHIFVMGVESEELTEQERTTNETESALIGALIDPKRFAEQK